MSEPGQSRTGELTIAAIVSLRPTQMSAGMAAAKSRLAKMEGKTPAKLTKYLANRPIPVVAGPDNALYMIDRHHMALALTWLGRATALCRVEADLSDHTPEAFWRAMADRRWARACDETGAERPFSCMPATVLELRDDPYRSLAGAARRMGAYAKSPRPYSEFLWADYFRAHIPAALLANGIESALPFAFELARAPEACELPGYQHDRGMEPASPNAAMVALRAIERSQQGRSPTSDASLSNTERPSPIFARSARF